MALLWALAAVVAATGAGLLILQVRAIGTAADELREQLVRLDEVRTAATETRSAAARTAALARGLRREHPSR